MMQRLPTTEWLDAVELQWPVDAEADPLVDEIFAGHELADVNKLLQKVVSDRDLSRLDQAEGLPPRLHRALCSYFEEVSSRNLPAWAEPERILRSQHVFLGHGFTSYLVLLCASLPECYLARDIAAVLAATHKLDDLVHRRVLETSQFVMDVMTPGGLTEGGGKGWVAVHRVRLLHATVRHLMRLRMRQVAELGTGNSLAQRLMGAQFRDHVPNNQILLGLTLQTFGHVILRGLADLGVELSESQRDDYIHTWSVIGHFLGIRDELLPSTHDQARELFELLKARQRAETGDGRDLERHLLWFAQRMLPWFLRGVPRYVTNQLMGEADCRELGVARHGVMGRLFQRLIVFGLRTTERAFGAVGGSLPPVLHAWEGVTRRLLTRVSQLPPDLERDIFELPDVLLIKPDRRTSRAVRRGA